MAVHQNEIPEFIDRFLVDPRAFLVVIGSPNEALVGQVWLPILQQYDDGTPLFGPGTDYPFIRATCDGFWLADPGGKGRVDFLVRPGDRILGVTFTSPEGHQLVCSTAAVVAVSRNGAWPDPPSSNASNEQGVKNRRKGLAERR